MTDDTLERLLIDRSLGALPADVDALLAAYIQSRPDALETARNFDSLVAATRHVLTARDERAAAVPSFDRDALGRRAAHSARTWRVASLAACLLIGVGLGAVAARRSDRAHPNA
jgi:hypothetical protein